MSNALELADKLDDTPNWQKEKWGSQWKHSTLVFSRDPFEAATELRRLAAVEAERDALKAENERLLAANRDCMLHYEDARAELERIRALEPMACIQHYKGNKGRLFFVADVDPPPGSPEYVEDVSWTLLYTLEKP